MDLKLGTPTRTVFEGCGGMPCLASGGFGAPTESQTTIYGSAATVKLVGRISFAPPEWRAAFGQNLTPMPART
jgi:hypothetical protein